MSKLTQALDDFYKSIKANKEDFATKEINLKDIKFNTFYDEVKKHEKIDNKNNYSYKFYKFYLKNQDSLEDYSENIDVFWKTWSKFFASMNDVLSKDNSINSTLKEKYRKELNESKKLWNKATEECSLNDIKKSIDNSADLKESLVDIATDVESAYETFNWGTVNELMETLDNFKNNYDDTAEETVNLLSDFDEYVSEIKDNLKKNASVHKQAYIQQAQARQNSKLFSQMKNLKSVLQSEPSSDKIHDIADSLKLVADSCKKTWFSDQRQIYLKLNELAKEIT